MERCNNGNVNSNTSCLWLHVSYGGAVMKTGQYTLDQDKYPKILHKPGMTQINGEPIFPQEIKVEIRMPDGGCYLSIELQLDQLVDFWVERQVKK